MCLVSTFRGQLLVSGATHVSLQTRSLLGEGGHRTHVHSRTRKASGTGPDRIQDRGSLGPGQRRSHAFRVRHGAPLTACGPGAVPSDPSAGRRGVQARERGVGDSVRGPRSRQGRRAEVFQASSASSSTLPGSRPVPVSSLKVTESLETTNSGSRDPGRGRGGQPSRGFRREPVTCILRLPGDGRSCRSARPPVSHVPGESKTRPRSCRPPCRSARPLLSADGSISTRPPSTTIRPRRAGEITRVKERRFRLHEASRVDPEPSAADEHVVLHIC